MNTHQINKNSKYYRGHLDPENHQDVMNCPYYTVFEQDYENIHWWNEKKRRIEKQIENNDENQMKVNILTTRHSCRTTILVKDFDLNKFFCRIFTPPSKYYSLLSMG